MTLFGEMFERRSVENPAVPLTSSTLLDWLGTGSSNDSGVAVTEKSSLQMPAVWRAVNLLAGTAAALPLKTYRIGTRDEAQAPLLRNPHPDMTPFELWETAFVHLLLWGNAYLLKVRAGSGRVVELWPLHPSTVQCGRVKPTDRNRSGKVFKVTDPDTGAVEPMTSDDILHIPGLGYDGVCGVSPIRLAAQGIGLALAAEKTGAKLFGSGNLVAGILQTEQRLDDAQAETLAQRWKAKRAGLEKAHDIAVMGSGTKFQPLAMPNSDAQFIESRKFQVSEIARWFGVPPHMLMDAEKSTSWGTGIEQQSIGFVVYTLRPWLTRVEQRITKVDEGITFRDVYAKYKVEGLLRGDSAARGAFYNVMRQVGAFSVNDIRELEDLPGVGLAGDTYLQPLNMAPLGSEGQPDDGGTPDGNDDSQP